MPHRFRKDWSRHVDQVIRSRHYTWLGEGLGGDPVDEALSLLTADIMHICRRAGIPWQEVVQNGRRTFEHEEGAVGAPGA